MRSMFGTALTLRKVTMTQHKKDLLASFARVRFKVFVNVAILFKSFSKTLPGTKMEVEFTTCL